MSKSGCSVLIPLNLFILIKSKIFLWGKMHPDTPKRNLPVNMLTLNLKAIEEAITDAFLLMFSLMGKI